MKVKKYGFEAQWMAKKVLNEMRRILEESSYVTVADYYDLANVPVDYIDSKFGWTDLSDVCVASGTERDTYVLTLPEPTELFKLSDKNEADMVNHPPHYQTKSGMEAIDVIESFTADLRGGEATNTGNVLKYMLRWKNKNGLQDLEKAKWYLERLIKLVKNNKTESEQ